MGWVISCESCPNPSDMETTLLIQTKHEGWIRIRMCWISDCKHVLFLLLVMSDIRSVNFGSIYVNVSVTKERSRFKCTVVGPRCLISCLQTNTPVPHLPYPMFTIAMKVLALCGNGLWGKNEKGEQGKSYIFCPRIFIIPI